MKYLWRYLYVLTIAFISLNCFKEPLSPVMPTWDATATFPLSSRTYTLGDLISKDTSLLKRGEGSQISLSKSAQFEPAFVSNALQLSPKDTSVEMRLGPFSVSSPEKRMPLSIAWLPQGYTMPIPDTLLHFDDIQSRLESFETVTLKSGTISLKIENNLPVPLQVQSPIQLFDLTGSLIATFVFSPSTIPAQSYRIASDDLGSKTVSSDYRITGLEFYIEGSATPVVIPNGDLLVATISTSGLKARQATLANIPPQHLADNDSAHLRIDDSTLVKEVFLTNGALNLAFRNDVALGMTFKFKFHHLYRSVGSSYIPYEDSVYLAAGGTASLPLNLAGTRIKSQNGELLNALSLSGSIEFAEGHQVTISETDRVLMAVTRNAPLIVDSAVGVIKPTWVNIDTKIPLNLGKTAQKFSGQLNLPTARFRLVTVSSVGFPADAYIRIGARKVTGDSVFLAVPASQRRVTPGGDEIQFSGPEVGQFLSQLSTKFPDSLRIVGQFLVNPHDAYNPTPAGAAVVGSRSSVSGSANVDISFNVGIVGGTVKDTLVIGDTSASGRRGVTFDQSFIDKYNSAKVYIELENGTPAEIAFNTSLLNISAQNLLTLPQSGQLIRLHAGQVNASGDVIAPSRSTTIIELNQHELSQFNPTEFVAYSVGVNTAAGGSIVQFKTNHQIKVRIWSIVSGRVGK